MKVSKFYRQISKNRLTPPQYRIFLILSTYHSRSLDNCKKVTGCVGFFELLLLAVATKINLV
jgi:hypothetical protein